jgi:hypothetical protein
MFKNTFQSGFLSILYSLGYVVFLFMYLNTCYPDAPFEIAVLILKSCICLCYRSKPLQIWDKEGERVLLCVVCKDI